MDSSLKDSIEDIRDARLISQPGKFPMKMTTKQLLKEPCGISPVGYRLVSTEIVAIVTQEQYYKAWLLFEPVKGCPLI